MNAPATGAASGSVPDAELALAASAGDMTALAAIYDRYADRLHDYCRSVLRDRDEAADAVQEVFITAARRLGQLKEPEKLRAWLYAVARHESLRRVGLRRRETVTEEVPEMPTAEPGLDEAARRSELAELVQDAAAGLAARDRAILDLHLRHGLEGQELADALGVTPSHAYVLLNRLRDSVSRSLGALLVARLGSDDCAELGQILSGWDGKFTPLIRKRVARHVDGCDVCDARRRTAASPLALLGAAPILVAPESLRPKVLGRLRLVADEEPITDPTAGGWRADGFPPPLPSERRRLGGWRLSLAAAAVLAVTATIGGTVALTGGAHRLSPVAGAEATSSPEAVPSGHVVTSAPPGAASPNASSSAPVASSSAADQHAGSSGPLVAGSTSRTAGRAANGAGAGAGATNEAAKRSGDTTRTAPDSITVSADPTKIETYACASSTSTVSATITGGSEPTSVVLSASVPGSGQTTGSMTQSSDGAGSWSYVATVGKAAKPGQLTFTVTETDAAGRTATSPTDAVSVVSCG